MVEELSKSNIKKRILTVVRDYLRNLEGKIEIKKVILFGSTARGKTHRDSDIDLIIISPEFRKMEFVERLIFLNRLRREMKKSAPMDILGYTPEEFERLSKESIVLKEAKKEGVVIK
ncbi:MAG: nucleotidyltransferase domain-containing protein [Candidatus Paceibacterales bacterium]